MIVVQPTLPGIGPPECTGAHALAKVSGLGWGRWWKRCSVCHVGVFTVGRRKR